MKTRETLVEMKGITKAFGSVVANDHVDFSLDKGEICALLGENGAGKTTLMKILVGLYLPDSGEIRVKGERISFRSPADAIRRGIGMVHQIFTLDESLTVCENIRLGLKPLGFWLNIEETKKQIVELGGRLGLEVDPNMQVGKLSEGQKQRVEILKILMRNPDVIILDEPTSVLTPIEVHQLFSTLNRLKETKGIVFISHHLDEVLEIASRVQVLRDGRVVGMRLASRTSKEELASMMVGREIPEFSATAASKGTELLRMENVSCEVERGVTALKNVSLTIYSGEIVGVAGVSGNGQKELSDIIVGLRKYVGRLFFEGKDLAKANVESRLKMGVALIPENRMEAGILPDSSIADNLILGSKKRSEVTRRALFVELLDREKVSRCCQELISEYEIKTPSEKLPARLLSGGNIQKLLLARILSEQPKVLIAEQPTRGLDVAATDYVHRKLQEMRMKGIGILLISEDLGEVLKLSDRVLVMFRGELTGQFRPGEVSLEEIGLRMGGAQRTRETGD